MTLPVRLVLRVGQAGLLIGGLGLFTGCKGLKPAVPVDQLTAQQSEGYQVFQARCATCHYERVSRPKNGPSLRGVFQHDYLPSGAPASDESVAGTVLHGRGMMPAQPDLDPESLAALLAYLHTV